MHRFRGGFPATIDAKGRVKLPARLREQLEEGFGREVFVCSFFPHELRVYPLSVWELVEERLLSQLLEVDDHGRLIVPALLREMVDVEGEVVVSGRINHLAINKRARAASILQEDSLSDEELEELARLEL